MAGRDRGHGFQITGQGASAWTCRGGVMMPWHRHVVVWPSLQSARSGHGTALSELRGLLCRVPGLVLLGGGGDAGPAGGLHGKVESMDELHGGHQCGGPALRGFVRKNRPTGGLCGLSAAAIAVPGSRARGRPVPAGAPGLRFAAPGVRSRDGRKANRRGQNGSPRGDHR